MKTYIFFILILMAPLAARAADTPSIIFSEIAWMGTVESGNDEWIELYNTTEEEIDLTGWQIKSLDGSPVIDLKGNIAANAYFLLERTNDDSAPSVAADQIYSGSLGNDGEWLQLTNASSTIVDEIEANVGWPGGDNTSKQTLARKIDLSWAHSKSSNGTPKAENDFAVAVEENEPTQEENAGNQNNGNQVVPNSNFVAKQGKIEITEILVVSNNENEEFIELTNTEKTSVDLTDWILETKRKQQYVIPSLIMHPGSIVIFKRSQTGLAFHDFDEKIYLKNKSGKTMDSVSTESAQGTDSYQKTSNGWLLAKPTPGKINTAKMPTLPTAIIYGPNEAKAGQFLLFSGVDSFDPENRPLAYHWKFGDGRIAETKFARQIYITPGDYKVMLTVTADNSASSTAEFKIKITGEKKESRAEIKETTTTSSSPNIIAPSPEGQADFSTPIVNSFSIPNIFISEFLPNPSGSDDVEFIELFNADAVPVNLGGLLLDDSPQTGKPYIFAPNTIIEPYQYKAFFKEQTKLSLNNSGDEIVLSAPDGTLIDYAEYEQSEEGQSFVRDEKFEWQQSQTPTPNEVNILDIKNDPKTITESGPTTTAPQVLGSKLINSDTAASADKNYVYLYVLLAAVAGSAATKIISKFKTKDLDSEKF